MKKLIGFLILALPSYAAITFTQMRAGGNDSVTSLAAGTASPGFASGDFVLVHLSFRNPCTDAGTVTVDDNGSGGSNTYAQVGSDLSFSSYTCSKVFKSTIANAATIVTGHFQNSIRFPSIIITHSTGWTTPTIDVIQTGTNSSNGIATTGTFSTTAAEELVVACMKSYNTETTWALPTGFGTFISPSNSTDPYSGSAKCDYQITSSTQTNVTVSQDISDGTVNAIFVVTVKDGTGGGGGATGSPRKRRVVF